jgi:3'(2'), 5'-bisphosphate nucleotidase
MTNLQQHLDAIVAIARDAGRQILEVYGREFSVQDKQDNSPLTEADQRAHELIAMRLAALPEAIPVLSEEDVGAFPGPDADGRYWLVDPLDGTKEFIKRNGEFTVNIALIENGYPVAGVVYAPVLDVMYFAASGLGALKQTGDQPARSMHCSTPADGQPWRVVGSRSHAGDSLAAFLGRLGDHTLVSMGSSLKFCLVAEGSADLYPRLGPTSLWDTAAAQCVVEQAGGQVLRLDGNRLSYANPSVTLNPSFIVTAPNGIDWRTYFPDEAAG